MTDIETWWHRIGCERNPGIHTGEELAMTEEIQELRAALELARKDAERYRWIRSKDRLLNTSAIAVIDEEDYCYTEDELDKEIDAAIAAEKEQANGK